MTPAQSGDYWSYGVMIYAMICGEWPFTIRTIWRFELTFFGEDWARVFLILDLFAVDWNFETAVREPLPTHTTEHSHFQTTSCGVTRAP